MFSAIDHRSCLGLNVNCAREVLDCSQDVVTRLPNRFVKVFPFSGGKTMH